MKKFEPFTLYIDSSYYPDLLKKSCRPPEKIFVRGNREMFKETFRACLSVVGSRKMTSYGKRATQKFVRTLAGRGITIVSGFMYGIDAEAHRAAIDAGGKTVAVMPCGIERICPAYQKELYYEILNSGGYILSEYEGDKSPRNWTFPQRNRIVAGLSQALLVVEAGGKSGTLITAKYARKGNRKIFAVPGSIFSANSKGTWNSMKSIPRLFLPNNLSCWGIKVLGI
jgi:DNA processing protein